MILSCLETLDFTTKLLNVCIFIVIIKFIIYSNQNFLPSLSISYNYL